MIRSFLVPAALILFLFNANYGLAFILIDDPGTRVNLPKPAERSSETQLRDLVEDLEQITALQLYVERGYLRAESREIGSAMNQPTLATHNGRKYSQTARNLLLSALRSDNVYRVRGAKEADFGRVDRHGSIELDFVDLQNITFRDVPHQTFNPGMIFLHELVHLHLGLLDPNPEEIKNNPLAKGDTVEYVNRIERELGLPERLHYFPKKSLDKRSNALCIYFGKGSDRIELDADLFAKKYKNKTDNGYLALVRK